MPPEPLRFMHASEVRIDVPLVGTGPLPDAARRIAEDASLTAFERLVDACLEHDVDFLLLTGQTLPDHPTVRAARAFRSGCRSLNDFGIPVYLLPPPHAPLPLAGQVPDNAVLLSGEAGEPVRFVRAGHVAATFSPRAAAVGHPVHERFHVAESHESRAAPLRIVWTTSDVRDEIRPHHGAPAAWPRREPVYDIPSGLAISSGSLTDDDDGPHPGSTQGLSTRETGLCGASLIEVDGAGRIERNRISTAPVRWEQFLLAIDPHTSRDEVIERMNLALLDRESAMGEQLWLVRWIVAGSGRLFAEWREPAAWDEICRRVEAAVGARPGLERIHRLDLRPRSAPVEDALSREVLRGCTGLDETQWQTVCRRIEERLQTAGVGAAEAIVAALDRSAMEDAAARAARAWLAVRS